MQKFLIKSSSSSNASTCSIASNNTNNNGNNSSSNSNGGSLLDARYHQRKKTKVSNLGQVGFGQGDLSKWHSKNDALGVRVEPMNALTTGAEKIAAFDLDGTIQTTKDYRMKDRPYMVSNCDGFKFRSPIVKGALSELYRAGWKIVIFSNQSQAKGAMNGVSARKIRERIDLLAAEMGEVKFDFYCATQIDKSDEHNYRKPGIGMYKEMLSRTFNTTNNDNNNNNNNNMKGILQKPSKMFFVGDAAGRSSDHSSADVDFAKNCACEFFTEDDFFERGAWRTFVATKKDDENVIIDLTTDVSQSKKLGNASASNPSSSAAEGEYA